MENYEIDGTPIPVPSSTSDTFLGIPIARFVTLIAPKLDIASGALASWLLVHVHFLGIFDFGHDQLAKWIASGAIILLWTGVSWLGRRAWVKGHHIELAGEHGFSVEPNDEVEVVPDTEAPGATDFPLTLPGDVGADEGDAGVAGGQV